MKPIVCKFGGSSTASAECFRQIRAILRKAPARRCVVLSAPGVGNGGGEKVTDLLERCWQLRRDPESLGPAIEAVAARYGDISEGLSCFDMRKLCESEIKKALFISRAHTISRGEYLCAALFAGWSGMKFADAAGLIAFESPGRLDDERTARQLAALGESGVRTVLPCFYGALADGRIVTFPRNGSDITGALAAAGMGAGLYENWTDVPGLMTADPSVVPGARLIRQVSDRQLRQLARAGAQVLHPDCLDPVALAGIPTRLRCTARPDCFGTLIDDHCEGVACCIAGRRESDGPESLDCAAPLAEISVFGLRERDVMNAAWDIDYLRAEAGRDCLCLYVPRDAYEEATRRLHRRLLE